MGVAPDGVQAMIDATLGTPQAPAPTDPRVAARMALAREQDVVVNDRDDLFDSRHIQLGIWRASDFLRDYGTALLLTAPYEERFTSRLIGHASHGRRDALRETRVVTACGHREPMRVGGERAGPHLVPSRPAPSLPRAASIGACERRV